MLSLRFISLSSFALALTIALVGCSGSTSPSTDGPQAANNGDNSGQPAQGPKETVADYLEAVKKGDAETVNRLLTTVAQRKTEELRIAVAPPGSETAHYTVGSASSHPSAQGVAHVESTWSDLNEENNREVYEITWILRKEAEGWRVAGMKGEFIEGQPEIVFNFEDPQQVIQQQDYARQELEQGAGGPRQAQAPPDTAIK